jgi:polyketide synthase PksJ
MKDPKIDKQNLEDMLGLTSMQEGMLFHYLSYPESKQYFEQIRLQLSGKINSQQFKNAWQIMGQTNEILRSVFRWEKLDEPVQIVFRTREIPIRVFDLSRENKEVQVELSKEMITNDKNQPIDLTEAPFRITLCKLDENKREMVLTFHHILIDGWSLGILLTEFLEIANLVLKGETPGHINKTKYKEFFKWYKNSQKQKVHQQQEFWKNYLEGFDTRTLLPYDTNKLENIQHSQRVNTNTIEVSSSLKAQVDACTQMHNVTLSTILYAAWGILLQKTNNSDDIIFGTTVSGRTPEVNGIDRMVALFINTLPLRLKAAGESTVLDIFQSIREHLLERNTYQHASLTQMKQFTGIGTENNLFDSIIVIDNYPLDNILNQSSDAEITITAYDTFEMTNFDLTVQIMLIDAEHMKIDFHYHDSCFQSDTINRVQGHYMNILAGITCNSSIKLKEIRMLSEREMKQILEEFNNPSIEFRVEKTINGVIETQVVRTPNNKAVQFQDQFLTYQVLNKIANCLAHQLKEHGVSPGFGSRIVMIFPRSIDMIVAVLGILKAGAACIPLDISYPQERNSFIVQDSEAKFLLTSQPGTIDLDKIPGVTEIIYNPEPTDTTDTLIGHTGKSAAPGDLSYIIYTSGSTGKPKGALLHHSGVVNHTYTKIDVLGITEKDTVANNFSINVIASVWQILSPLFTSARLMLYNEEIEWDPYLQFQRVAVDGVTVIEVIPSVLKAYLFILDEGKEKITLTVLRKIALTSEETKPVLVNKFYSTYSHIDLVDCYGQTECCDDVLHYTIPHDTNTMKVPVGTPSLNTQVLILSHHYQLQPIGIAGEICIIGAGVTYGYWKRPELTAEKFIMPSATRGLFLKKPPPGPPQKLFIGNGHGKVTGKKIDYMSHMSYMSYIYRTGDLGRWLPDGKVEFLGRIDHQVKIRGNRVELREIENHLLRYPAVKEAVVVAKENREGEQNLYAFFISDDEITTSHIRQFLLTTLPGYMIPAYFVPMEKLPLTPNGKIDRKVLLKTECKSSISTGIAYQPPRNDIQWKIRDIWSRLLEDKEKQHIGINDNFFELGGHSLLLIKLKNKLEKTFNLIHEIGIIELFNYPTIAHQAQFIEENLKFKEKQKESKDLVCHYKFEYHTNKPLNKNVCRGESATHKAQGAKHTAQNSMHHAPYAFPLAVVGISLHIPGAANIHEFWQNLINGIESISFFKEEELEGSEVDNYVKGNCQLVPAGGIIGDIEEFDADFFGLNPREAEIIEPQQRLFLEHAWKALEDAGYGAMSESYPGKVGVYAGVGLNTYLLNNVMANRQVVNALGEFQTMIGNDKDFLATRVAYKLNLKGPAITLQTACSTSLVAVHLARQGLLNRDCDMALVGGVAVHVPEKTGYFYNEGGYLSPDGHCRAFDAEAKGTVFGNGIGVVVLKSLPGAINDNDHIYAVVKSSAINNDGSLKVGYTSPSEIGQAAVILRALEEADITPNTIGYIETHGTGTVLGDPVEMAALERAFREAANNHHLKKQYCAIGSVKSNIGHLDIAAGIIGFIKAVLCLNHKQIPPGINVETTNPIIDFANTPFYVNLELTHWPVPAIGTPRRAGVSSFGIGGTNAHVVLEEWNIGQNEEPKVHSEIHTVHGSMRIEKRSWNQASGRVSPLDQSHEYQLILLSARTETALKQTTQNLVIHLKQDPDIPLADTSYTLTVGRKAFDHRMALVCRDRKDAIDVLESLNPKRIVRHTCAPGDKAIVFMFPGVGEHYVNMAYDLYRQEPVFKQHLDRCCDILQPLLEKDLRDILFVEKLRNERKPGKNKTNIDLRKLLNREEYSLSEEEKLLSRTIYSQTSVFVVEYALAQLLMEWGIKPFAMIGYSIGEYTAACLSGVFSLADALFLVAGRARLLHGLDTGSMTAISLPEIEIKRLISGDSSQIAVAAVNAPDLCIVSGKPANIEALEQLLQARNVVFRRLKTFQAFHSPMMETVREELTVLFDKVTWQAPTIPYISNVTGTWVKAEEVCQPGYWVTHTVSPIRFSHGIGELLKTSCNFFFEIGPGNSLCGSLAQHHKAKKSSAEDRFVLASLPKESENISSETFLLRALSKMWAAGLEIRWDSFYKYKGPARKRVALPTYPFEKKRYWLEAAAREKAITLDTSTRIAKEENITNWFYLPYWKQSLPPLTTAPPQNRENEENWLLFSDDSQIVQKLTRKLKTSQPITIVKIGQKFAKHQQEGNEVYTINPGQEKDYITLFQHLSAQGSVINKIIHLWQWSSPGDSPVFLDYGVYSLLYLVKTMGKLSMFNTIEIWMVSRGLHQIESSDSTHPARAAILGPCKVISQEYPNIICRSIDFQDESAVYYDEQRIVQQLVSELRNSSPDRVIAFRGTNRWVQSYDDVKPGKGPEVPVVLQNKGVYLVSGGLGNIGFSIAQYLAESVQARLVLTTRSAWPVKEQNHPRMMKVKQLEKLGAQVLVVQADAADKQQMQETVKQAEETFGPLNGVLYAAGIMDDSIFKLIANASREDCELHFKTKIYGLMVLEEVLRDKKPDFCLLTSSLSPILGGLSLFAYSAGNSFMDAFAHRQALVEGKNWLSLNWADWQRREPVNETCANLVLGSTVLQLDITPEEGKETFKRVLSLFYNYNHNGNRIPQLVVSSGDLHRRLQQWVLVNPSTGTDASTNDSTKTSKQIVHQRPRLQSIYEAPKNEAEKIVAEIWQELLGIELIGVHDNFFELGGHSLIATKLISRLREIFRIDIPLPTLFDRPTIRELVDNIAYTWGDSQTVAEIAKTYRDVQALP